MAATTSVSLSESLWSGIQKRKKEEEEEKEAEGVFLKKGVFSLLPVSEKTSGHSFLCCELTFAENQTRFTPLISLVRCVEMQRRSNNRMTEFEQLRENWTTLLNRVCDDPKVSQLMNSRVGQYLSSHPVIALTVMLFSAIAALPVGLFLTFALVTIIMSAVGFVFFEMFLLFAGGLTLLCVLSGIALFSVVVSFIFNVFYITVSNILKGYYPHLTKAKVQGKESDCETSKLEEMQ